ncbi:MAG: hypothetical protein P4L84_30405 [Isosphaeraceae bacterium]|nr:hypothetical protein [Isosphaeraceae bacterium]
MNRSLVDPIANAVLYEGYILYPYRPSTKNQQRWTFGGLYPESYCRALGGEAWCQQTECLVHGTPETTFEAVARFLHLTSRQVGQVEPPLAELFASTEPTFRPVESLQVGDKTFQSWQEAEEREVPFGGVPLGALCARPRHESFAFPGGRVWEPLVAPDGHMAGVLVRARQALQGTIDVSALEVDDRLFRVTFRVANQTPPEEAGTPRRDQAQLRSLASTHAILGVRAGAFVSLMDPPDRWREAASGCRNIGAWPVLVGEEGQADTMLASPIILYDYPQVAPESPGNYFDGTEMDEMLTLRIMTLTDDEKSAMASVDERAGALLARTETLAREQLAGLHGAVRALRPMPEENLHV